MGSSRLYSTMFINLHTSIIVEIALLPLKTVFFVVCDSNQAFSHMMVHVFIFL